MYKKMAGVAFAMCALSGTALANGVSVDTKDSTQDGKLSISNWAGVDNIIITVTDRLAGAVDSLTWLNQEFVDSYDHGRQIQTALAFPGPKECYNPTEAGTDYDSTGSTSSSYLHAINKPLENVVQTYTQMAFWHNPNGCTVSPPQLSAFLMNKEIRIGKVLYNNQWYDFPHAVKYDTTIHFPSVLPASIEAEDQAGIEAIAHYLDSDFNNKDHVFMFDPAGGQYGALTEIDDCTTTNQGAANCFLLNDDWIETAAFITKPVIIKHNHASEPGRTDANTLAVGMITDSEINNPNTTRQWYRVTYYPASSGQMPDGVSILKTTLFHSPFKSSVGTSWTGANFSYRTYIVVGSVQNVKTTMWQMYSLWNQ